MDQLFSRSFNNFSNMQHRLQKKVDVVLGHDAPSWSMRYGCLACGFEMCSPLCSMLQCTHCFFFSNQMKKTFSLHKCTPFMVVILKKMKKQPVHSANPPLTTRFFSLPTFVM